MSIRWCLIVSFCLPLSLSAAEFADEAPATPPIETATAAEIAEWVQQLESLDFAVRKASAQSLIQRGRADAVPAVQRRAESNDLDLAVRCLTILTQIMQQPEPASQEAARAALKALSRSSRRSVAQRATAVVDPPVVEEFPARAFRRRNLQFRAVPGVPLNVVQQQGNLQVQVEEAGRKVVIQQSAEKGIRVEVTEEKEGRKVTQGYEAKTLEDLKKAHPEAHKLFEKYAGQQPAAGVGIAVEVNAIAVEAIAVPLQVQQIQIAVPAQPDLPANPEPVATRKSLNELAFKIRRLAQSRDAVDPTELRKLARELEAAAEKLEQK